MLCNHKKSRSCLFVLAALLAAMLAGCGGDEPAAPTPPPTPPPRPVFVPTDVPVQLGESGEQVTLQTTEAGGFTLKGEAFTSGTTVEAAGNTYRLTLADGTWTAEYVAPKPWFAALGTSGTNLVITRREDGLYEAEGDPVHFGSGAIKVVGGNKYRLTFVEEGDTGRWEAEYVPSEITILLGDTSETVTLQSTEDGGFLLGETRVVHRYPYRTEGRTYRLLMAEDGTWTAVFEPTDVVIDLGASGQQLTLQTTETGGFTLNGEPFMSGSTHPVGRYTYRLTLAEGVWTAMFVVPEPAAVQLGTSGESITLQATQTGAYTRGGAPFASGSTVEAGGNTYRLTLAEGATLAEDVWTATYVAPDPTIVTLPGSDVTVSLQLGEDGAYYLGRTRVTDGYIHTSGGDDYVLSFRGGVWSANLDRPATQTVTLGELGGTVTLVAVRGAGYALDGEPVRNGQIIRRNGREYRLTEREDGTWSAAFRFQTVSVDLPLNHEGPPIILITQEDGSITYNGDPVAQDGSAEVTHSNGNRYELLLRSDGSWLAYPARASATGDQRVNLPGGPTITLTRTSTGTYTYDDRRVSSGNQITVDGNRYTLTQDSEGIWSARAVSDTTIVDPGGLGGPTQTDSVDTFTQDTDHFDTSDTEYGVKFTKRGVETLSERGTRIVPLQLLTETDPPTTIMDEDNAYEFPVYELMQQSLVSQKRTFVEVARAKLEDIVSTIQLRKDEYSAGTVDPDIDIADSDKLWDLAERAVGRIFGLDAVASGGLLGSDPWRRTPFFVDGRYDSDGVDAVIEALQYMITVLSDSARFAREFRTQINDTEFSASDFFSGDMYRIRFGSTGSTRFGAYAVKKSTDTQPAHAALDGMWEPGVFAYTPSDEPAASDIPDRAEAKYTGNTVAVSPDDGGTDGVAKVDLYAGKIELIASFTRKRVTGTVTELKDESGKTFEFDPGFGKEAVRSISLAPAPLQDTHPGSYKAAATGEATLFFVANRPTELDATETAFTVQLVEDATEAFGVWKAFGLEGSFGATRTGAVSKPTLPAEVDRGGKAVEASVYAIVNGASATSGAAVTIIAPDDEDSTLTLTSAQLGLSPAPADTTPVVTQTEFDRDFPTLKLKDLYGGRSRTRRSSTTIASKAHTEIGRVRSGLTTDTFGVSAAETILSTYFGISVTLPAGDLAEARRSLDAVRSALGSDSRFKTALTADGVFGQGSAVTGWPDDRIRRARSERRWDFGLRFAKTRYTRFGVWSQISPTVAGAAVEPEEGSFAYSPLGLATSTTLSFAAEYNGTTLAVNEETGHLYSGRFELRVNWSTGAAGSRPIESTITDLKGVHGTTTYFKHDSKDVKSLFFSGITVDDAAGTFSATGARVTVSYRTGSSRDMVLTPSAGEMVGAFVKDTSFDEPVGVLGVWSIPEVTGMSDAFTGSFGADLVP